MSNLFAELDVKEHSTQRRRIASLYSMTTLLSYESFIDSCTTILMEKFNKFARERRPVEMVQWLQFYAFDVIGAITVSNMSSLPVPPFIRFYYSINYPPLRPSNALTAYTPKKEKEIA